MFVGSLRVRVVSLVMSERRGWTGKALMAASEKDFLLSDFGSDRIPNLGTGTPYPRGTTPTTVSGRGLWHEAFKLG